MLCCMIFCLVLHVASSAVQPNYAEEFPLYCAGSKQSPINVWAPAVVSKEFPPLVFTNYTSAPTAEYVTNNLHTLSGTADFSTVPTISGGALPFSYEFVNFHFHWGSGDAWGSEHTVDGNRFPLEMHVVHKQQGVPIAEALEKPNGLAVLSVFFHLSPADNVALSLLLSQVELISSGGLNEVWPIPLRYLLPNDVQNYYTYSGSLTTPVCNEAVLWTIFTQTLPVSAAQLQKLRSLRNEDGLPLQDNFRDTQPLNGRIVYSSF